MKVTELTRKQNNAFTLIEMIGVLAVIAILAALLIPKVFQAITEARINTVPVGAATCKTATVDHYAKYGNLASVKGVVMTTLPTAAAPVINFDDNVLMVEGFLDKPFAPRVGTGADIIITGCSPADTTVAGDNAGVYNLIGLGTTNHATGSYVIEAVVTNVAIADAQAISMRIDGATMSQAEGTTTADLLGRVKYPAEANGVTTVWIYLTHR